MKDRYSVILLDLDGTIINSHKGITSCLRQAMEYVGLTPPSEEIMSKFIGPPFTVSFPQYFPGITTEKSREATLKYRQLYADGGILEHEMYEGMGALLQKLCGQGRQLILATSKPQMYAEDIIRHNGLWDYFACIAGSGMDGSLNSKAQVIEYALAKSSVQDKSAPLMIGDTLYDVEGAAANGIDCCGVLYGFGNREELAGARYIVHTVGELERFLDEH